jgi:hypothetical protein
MALVSKDTPLELVVNFYCRETSRQERVNVWKVQSAPPVNIQVGQKIWFQSNIFVMGRDVGKYMKTMREQQSAGKYRYEGEVLHIVGWQKQWVWFSMGIQGEEEFHLWVPVHWTALGFLLRALHVLQRGRLPDNIPSLPKAVGPAFNVSTAVHNSKGVSADFQTLQRTVGGM